jgi:hypothetical protein
MIYLHPFVPKILENGAMLIVIGLMLEVEHPLRELSRGKTTAYLAKGRGICDNSLRFTIRLPSRNRFVININLI